MSSPCASKSWKSNEGHIGWSGLTFHVWKWCMWTGGFPSVLPFASVSELNVAVRYEPIDPGSANASTYERGTPRG